MSIYINYNNIKLNKYSAIKKEKAFMKHHISGSLTADALLLRQASIKTTTIPQN